MATKKDYLSARELSTQFLLDTTRRALQDKDAWSWKFKGLKEPRHDSEALDVRVSPKNIKPALEFMESFIDYALLRGHDVIVKYSETRVIIKGHEDKVSFRERTRVIPKDPTKEKNGFSSRQYEPTGVLTFKNHWHVEWKEGTNGLTLIEQIPNMFLKFEAAVESLHAGWEQMRIEREKEEEKRRALEEQQTIIKNELRSFKQLLRQA